MNMLMAVEGPVAEGCPAPAHARVGILGATGYAGRELTRLLAGHPRVEIGFATSESERGAALDTVWRGAPALPMCAADAAPVGDADIVFSCLPHGYSARAIARFVAAGARVIDLSADLRVANDAPDWGQKAVYGLPELHRDALRDAQLVANPGCYPTAALLALAPALRRDAVDGVVVIDAASGITGAGRTPKRELLFAEVAEDFRAYAAGNVHRHLGEIVGQARAIHTATEVLFTPHLLPIRRGILETIHLTLADGFDPKAACAWWMDDYAGEAFVEVLESGVPSISDAVGTNRVVIGVAPVAGVSRPMLTIVAAIDNLIKGAAGQAVQNMNLMFGWNEAEGLLG